MDTNDIRIKRQSLFNVDIEYRFFIIKSILEIYEKADKERRELDFDELKRIKDLPCYPDNRQETILGFNFFKLTNKYNIDDLILDAITIMDNLGGKDTKELFSDYCIFRIGNQLLRKTIRYHNLFSPQGLILLP